MKKVQKSWIEYWDEESIFSEKIRCKNMEIFVRKTKSILDFNNQDIVLDIGCGLGHLPTLLKNQVKEIHCLETSKRSIEICKEKFKNDKNIYFYHLAEDYLDFSFLSQRKFSKIASMGIIYYYKDINEVERLIREVEKIAQHNAKFLISDIAVETNLLKEAVGLLKGSVKENMLLETLRFFWQAKTSEYAHVRKENGYLILKEKDLKEIIEKLNLKADILNQPLSLNANRCKNLLIHF